MSLDSLELSRLDCRCSKSTCISDDQDHHHASQRLGGEARGRGPPEQPVQANRHSKKLCSIEFISRLFLDLISLNPKGSVEISNQDPIYSHTATLPQYWLIALTPTQPSPHFTVSVDLDKDRLQVTECK